LDKVALTIHKSPETKEIEQKVQEPADKIRVPFINAIAALTCALQAKDGYIYGHSQRVAETSMAIAGELGMPQDTIDKIRLAGLVHDIGMIGVKESILNKPGRLTDEDNQHITSHPEVGERILAPITEDKEFLQLVRHHHERYDGKGYPDGLAGEQIPLGARILAVSDAYDALTSDRSYRASMTTNIAYIEIELGKGTQFDPRVADIFFKIMNWQPS